MTQPQHVSGMRAPVRIWDAATGQLQREFKGHSSCVNSVAFSPSGERVASGSWDNTVRIWDAATGQLQIELKGHSRVTSVAFSPSGARVASGSWDSTVRIWDAATGQLRRELKGHRDWVNSVSFSRDGTRVVSGPARARGAQQYGRSRFPRTAGMQPRGSSSESSRGTKMMSTRSRFPRTARAWQAGAKTTRSGSGRRSTAQK